MILQTQLDWVNNATSCYKPPDNWNIPIMCNILLVGHYDDNDPVYLKTYEDFDSCCPLRGTEPTYGNSEEVAVLLAIRTIPHSPDSSTNVLIALAGISVRFTTARWANASILTTRR